MKKLPRLLIMKSLTPSKKCSFGNPYQSSYLHRNQTAIEPLVTNHVHSLQNKVQTPHPYISSKSNIYIYICLYICIYIYIYIYIYIERERERERVRLMWQVFAPSYIIHYKKGALWGAPHGARAPWRARVPRPRDRITRFVYNAVMAPPVKLWFRWRIV